MCAAAAPVSAAQTELTPAAPAPFSVVRWTGSLPEAAGRLLELRFAIYQDQAGGLALWSETQPVKIGADGKYSVLLGATSAEGLPAALFSAGVARWIEAKPATAATAQTASAAPRTLLAAVPYALKSVDSENLAGRAASDYVTREDLQSAVAASALGSSQVHPDVSPTGSGTTGYVPLWTTASNLGDSVISNSGTNVGIDTATPATPLDVNGATTLRQDVDMPALAVATATAGYSSPVLSMNGSSFFNGGAAINQKFAWEVRSAGNNTAAPSSLLSLLFASGTNGLAPTGLSILPSGSIFSQANMTVLAPAATASVANSSSKIVFEASSFNSTSAVSVPQSFAFSAVPNGNNTPSPSANLNLLFAAGSSVPAPTGLSFSPSGVVNFVPAQTFPGTGTGTITGITATSPITGGGTSGAVTLGLSTSALETTLNPVYAQLGAANTFAMPITFAATQKFPGTGAGTITGVTAGTGLKGGGTSGAVTLNVDSTKVPLLATANSFTGNQTITGNLTASGSVNAGAVSAGEIYASGIRSQGAVTSMGQIVGVGSMIVNPLSEATAAAGDFSEIGPTAVAYNSATKGQVYDSFFWTAYPVNNNTSNPSAKLELLFQTPTASNNTGFSISNTGIVTFAGGQTFPGGKVNGGEMIAGPMSAASGTFSGPVLAKGIGGLTALVGNGSQGSEGLYASSQTGTAAYGVSFSPSAGSAGVFGLAGSGSTTQATNAAHQVAGVWGDTAGSLGTVYSAGVIGTADDADGGSFFNNSKSYATIYANNSNSGGVTGLFRTLMAVTDDGTCGIGGSGDLSCTGQIKSLVSASGGTRRVETYAVQSPENWMEDFGSGQLVRGSALVKIDPAFAETVSESAEYHVFLTPKGDSKGLYVVNETAAGFEVRESGGGTSSLAFDYRIVAKRRGYEAQRLTDVTERFNAAQKQAIAPEAVRP